MRRFAPMAPSDGQQAADELDRLLAALDRELKK
jgi:hypothetical protein